MIGRVTEIKNLSEARRELFSIGSDKLGIELMAPKAVARAVKLKSIKPIAANIIKQEMLSFGGEAATAYGSINNSIASTDLLIVGTLKQIGLLVEKLKHHQFGLPQIADEIKLIIKNCDKNPKPINIKGKTLCFGRQTYIMGVLNVTPDSFSDGDRFLRVDEAVAHGRQMLEDGADIIDVGGESTRPGSDFISSEEEIKRVLPVIERLASETGAVISIDTTKSDVAQKALSAGASMVNDISGLRFDPDMAKVAADYGAPVCIMHIQGNPRHMQENPVYSDPIGEILDYLEEGLEIAEKAGILHEKIIVDPGIGFGKTADHNLEILNRLKELKVLGRPILVGTSRKSLIGKILELPVGERVEGTAATVAVSIANGADIIRVHDVKQMVRVARMTDAIIRRSRDGEEEI